MLNLCEIKNTVSSWLSHVSSRLKSGLLKVNLLNIYKMYQQNVKKYLI